MTAFIACTATADYLIHYVMYCDSKLMLLAFLAFIFDALEMVLTLWTVRYFDISFIRAMELKIQTEANIKAASNRPEEPKKSTNIVVKGDSLWKISQKFLGSRI